MHRFVSRFSVLLLVLAFSRITAELVDRFTKCGDLFFLGKAPVIPGILKNSAAQHNNYKIICQRYQNSVRFATLYDTARKIPLFSAYKYTGAQDFTNVKTPWMIESQLEPKDSAMREPFDMQAITEDYHENQANVNPGLLFPVSHAADGDTAASAYTLTNSIPEKNSLLKDIRCKFENPAREYMNTHCRLHQNSRKVSAYVLYGAVPGDKMLNNRVNIPSFKWIAICCFNPTEKSWKAKAIKIENKGPLKTVSPFEELETFQKFLSRQLGRPNENLQLFYNNCGKS